MGFLFKYNHRPRSTGMWSGMVALVRTVVGVSLVGGLLVVLLWSEQQVGVKTPAHTHFHAHARGIPPESAFEEASEKEEVSFHTVTERLGGLAHPAASSSDEENSRDSPARPFFPHHRTNSSSSQNHHLHNHRRPHHHNHLKSKTKNGTDAISFPAKVPNSLKTHPKGSSSGESQSSASGNLSLTSNSKSMSSAMSSSPSSSSVLSNNNDEEGDAGNTNNLVFNIDNSVPAPNSDMPKIYVITPTYRRPEQVAELTRLAQTLMLVPNLHWLVAEDSIAPTRRVLAFLDSCSVPHTYLLATASRRYKGANKPRGVSNRNAGLKWLKVHAKEGVFYFADDDNTYDYRIFNEMRWTKRVSMFPVGLVTRLGVSSPIVSDGKLIGFYDGWIAGRKFPVDMAGFAVNVQFYLQRNSPMMPYSVGFEEDGFLKALNIKPEEIEPLADNCTKILVWHTRTVKTVPALKMPDTDKVSKTNLNQLKPQMVFQMPFGLS
ncbi:galactosylgalactosylxylosylprotein 3-beta-glucuronosyltransferase P-like isoform X2 [Macrobrachium rosenbergii]|uniref:galactosylgalactosylxylosylprotein 3-beta-glucuronosyltransferase P-like isoform X2 n=1 Tax=Macrobrachium rosenbergii TaxID=79674 RepID=UPI0034D5CD80